MSGANSVARSLTLVSHYLCPYVQRVTISLAEKQVHFERSYVDLSNKPDWFSAVWPLGKVPLLQIGSKGSADRVIFESAVILEYLEETEGYPLQPSDPYERARHRAFIEFASTILNAIGRFYSAKTEIAFRQEANGLRELFARVESELENSGRGDGPWFSGARFSLVDAAFAPVFRYFDVFDQIAEFHILAVKCHPSRYRQLQLAAEEFSDWQGFETDRNHPPRGWRSSVARPLAG
jgi:glutathione S-transferase